MKHIAQSLTLGLAVLAASSLSPKAADWAVGSGGAFGGVKDYRNAAVAVPAPRPAPSDTQADWYLRGDFGVNLATSVDITATGGITARNGEDTNGFLFGGVGFGRYITPNLRADLTFDFRPKKTVTSGVQNFDRKISYVGPTNGLGNATTDTLSMHVAQLDNSSTSDQTAFVNLYYDFNHAGRFTPYVGAGIGIDSRRYKRVTSQASQCYAAVNTDNVTGVATPYASCNYSGPNFNDDKYTSELAFAAAFMIGATYEVMPGIKIDSGYRMVWEGASVSLTAQSLDGSTSVRISDRIDHELRTGVRFDLN